MIMKSTQITEERTEKEDTHMTPEKEEEEVTLMMTEDIGTDQT